MGPFLDVRAFLQSLKRPICALPIALFALAAVGTLWSDAPWGERLYAVGPAAKLLDAAGAVLSFRTLRARHVRCSIGLSGVLRAADGDVLDRRVRSRSSRSSPEAEYGVPVKNYIDQSQEFALCAVVLAYPVITLLRAKRIWLAALLVAISLSFVVNMVFVSVSRTALVTMPIMLAVFALLHLKWRSIVIIVCAATVLAGLAWAASPQLRRTAETFLRRLSESTRNETSRPRSACGWYSGKNRCGLFPRPR